MHEIAQTVRGAEMDRLSPFLHFHWDIISKYWPGFAGFLSWRSGGGGKGWFAVWGKAFWGFELDPGKDSQLKPRSGGSNLKLGFENRKICQRCEAVNMIMEMLVFVSISLPDFCLPVVPAKDSRCGSSFFPRRMHRVAPTSHPPAFVFVFVFVFLHRVAPILHPSAFKTILQMLQKYLRAMLTTQGNNKRQSYVFLAAKIRIRRVSSGDVICR